MASRLAACAAALAVLAPVPAAIASGTDVVADCNANNGLSQNWSTADLNSALNNLPADVDEYSDCRAIIKNALSREARNQVRKPPILNAKKPTQKQLAMIERQIKREARKRSSGGVGTDTAGAAVLPGAGKTLRSAVEPGIPGTLALAIAGIALIGVAEFGGRIRRYWLDRKPDNGPLG